MTIQALPPALLWLLVLIVSLAALIKASDWFTEAAEAIGLRLGIAPFVVGATIVAFGTSLPELVSSILAVLDGASEIVAGNVIGSNVANLLFALGLSASVARHMDIKHDMLRFDLPMLVGAALVTVMVVLDGRIDRFEALGLLAALALYIHHMATDGSNSQLATDAVIAPDHGQNLPRAGLTLILSGVVVYFGAKYTIRAVIGLSQSLDIGTDAIAATAVAFGTSLPEVAVTIAAARQNRAELAVGNLLGSNVFNSFAVLGVSALVGPLAVLPLMLNVALPTMLAATALTLVILLKRAMSKWEGWLMLILYVLFLRALLLPGMT